MAIFYCVPEMASPSSLLSEEQFLCSICLDVFTDPVTISCGHNFCMACISGYWNTTDQCPMCKQRFYTRTELRVNTFIAEMAAQFRKLVQVKAPSSPGEQPAEPEKLSCDVCTGKKLKALKSCLQCLTSYCETHLQPHVIAPALKRHKLIDPVDNLEDRMCKKHDRLLELFCKTDQTCVCQFCTETDHKTHHTTPLEEEFGERKAQLGKTESQVQQMIRERLQKVKDIKRSVEVSKKDAKREITDGVQFFTALVQSIERSQADLIAVIEKKQKAAEMQAEGLINELEQEITELKRRCTELEQLSHTEDHLHLLQRFPSLCSPMNTRNWSKISVYSDLCVGNLRRAVSQLEETVTKEMLKLCDAELKRVQQWSVDVTLDPDTRHHNLVMSEDGKKVRDGYRQHTLQHDPERFWNVPSVMGKEGFSSGRFYYEVQVEGKTTWFLGLMRESTNRALLLRSPDNGFWIARLIDDQFCPIGGTRVCLQKKLRRVGVFVDYEEGQVSFYDVENKSHIFSFIGDTFTEKLYPYFNPGRYDDGGGDNSAPLVITPVNHTD
ncbi:E3 ubiquitin-protein ligase TRIM39-like [Coregonus clupeaformis]|uniref:E3 ubiquitin-protein ligase TRIM39-like n=1 Tax=Coregonus clupeaformis TaxID=59861 RepID=UPI001BDFCF50|nr:E3 ubiquitin-protein ligase TRIM39-like [Coregonus clupeaformis]